MAEAPLLTREQWAAITSKDAEAIASHAVRAWYEQRAVLFDHQSLSMVMIGRLIEAAGCRDMAKRLRYWAHVEQTNPGEPMAW